MSSKFVFFAMEAKTGNPMRKSVLIGLADNADNEGVCFPSYQHIADKMEISKRTVMVHVKALEEMGFISKEARHLPTGMNRSNVYRLMLDGSGNPTKKVLDGGAGDSLGDGAGAAPYGAGDSLGDGAGAAPITCHSFNQSINHNTQRAREAVTINPSFAIDNDVRVAMMQAGVTEDLAEWCIVEFVTSNVESGWQSLNWPTEFVRYCKRQEARFLRQRSGAGDAAVSDKPRVSNAEVVAFVNAMDDGAVKRVFVNFMRYENKFFSKLRDVEVRDAYVDGWRKAMSGVSDNQLNYGLAKWRDAWPADAGAFRALCFEVSTPVVAKPVVAKTEAEKRQAREAAKKASESLPAHLQLGRAR